MNPFITFINFFWLLLSIIFHLLILKHYLLYLSILMFCQYFHIRNNSSVISDFFFPEWCHYFWDFLTFTLLFFMSYINFLLPFRWFWIVYHGFDLFYWHVFLTHFIVAEMLFCSLTVLFHKVIYRGIHLNSFCSSFFMRN